VQNEPQWCKGMIVTRGDGAKVACVNNNSVRMRWIAGAVKSPHARIFLTHSQTHAEPHANPLFLTPHGALTTLTTLTTHAHGCKENVKSALWALQSIPGRVTLWVEKKKGVSTMVLGTLTSSPGQPYLTWKDAKRQIRSLVKASSVKPSGTFRQRKINRGELSLPIEGGHVVASRQPGAEVRVITTTVTSASNLDADTLAAIMAQG
jgi:hypothetical protein